VHAEDVYHLQHQEMAALLLKIFRETGWED